MFKPLQNAGKFGKTPRTMSKPRSSTSRVKMHRVPFVVYTDFECFVEPTDNKIGDKTVQYQKHSPSGFCYTVKCMDESTYEDRTVLYTTKEKGEDIGKEFVKCLEKDLKEVYKRLKTVVPI